MAPKNLYFAGTAGCGKSTLTGTFQEWMKNEGYDAITVNLDPGADSLLYAPDVDVRDWIKLSEVMKEYGLGPNGAQILAADMLALNIGEVAEVVQGFDPDYVLIDTPGQLELFAFRQSSKVVVESLGTESSAIAFLFDPVVSKDPNGYVTSLMLASTVHFRLPIPMISVLAKADLVPENERETLTLWGTDYYALFGALCDSEVSAQTQISAEFLQALESVGAPKSVNFVSSETWEGLEDIYALVQQVLEGGEDIDR